MNNITTTPSLINTTTGNPSLLNFTTGSPYLRNATTEPPSLLCARSSIDRNPSRGYYFAAALVVGCLIMFENLLVFVAVAKTKKLRKTAYLYMASLAMADFLAGLQIAIAFRKQEHADTGKEMELIQSLFLTSIGVSCLTLLLLSINRYHVIVHPFHYRVNMNNTITAVAIAASWVYAIVLSFAPMMGWEDATDCSRVYPGLTRSFVFFASLHVLVVLLVTIVLYVLIFIKVRQSSKRFKKQTTADRTHWKVAKTLAIVTFAFAACYIPLMTVGVLDLAGDVTYTKIAPFFTLLAVLNSGLNPVIYAFRDTDLRREFKAILCPCLSRKDVPGSQASRSRSGSSSSTCFTACLSSRDQDITPYEPKKKSGEENRKLSADDQNEGQRVVESDEGSDKKSRQESDASAKTERTRVGSDEN